MPSVGTRTTLKSGNAHLVGEYTNPLEAADRARIIEKDLGTFTTKIIQSRDGGYWNVYVSAKDGSELPSIPTDVFNQIKRSRDSVSIIRSFARSTDLNVSALSLAAVNIVEIAPTDDFVLKINSAPSNTFFRVKNGYYKTDKQLRFRTGFTFAPETDFGVTFEFVRPVGTWNTIGDKNTFGVVIDDAATNIECGKIIWKSNCGIFWAGIATTNIRLLKNKFTWGWSGSYYNRFVFYSNGSIDGWIVENNDFLDSISSDRNFQVGGWRNGSYSYNFMDFVNDGGHPDGLSLNFKMVGNFMQRLHRMGLELQDHGTTTTNHGDNILIADNVYVKAYKPYNDTFGLSIIPQRSTNVIVRNNYMSAAEFSGGWGTSEQRFGYAIETGFQTDGTTSVEGNTFIGPWVGGIVAALANTPIKNNKGYGTQAWGSYYPEPGINGMGSFKDLGNNLKNLAMSSAPAIPPNTAGTGGTVNPPPPPPPVGKPTALDAIAYNSIVDMSWINPTGSTGSIVRVFAKPPNDTPVIVSVPDLPAGQSAFRYKETDLNKVNNHWELAFTVEAKGLGSLSDPKWFQLGLGTDPSENKVTDTTISVTVPVVIEDQSINVVKPVSLKVTNKLNGDLISVVQNPPV